MSWSSRINEAFRRLAPADAQALKELVAREALEQGIWMEEDGKRSPIRLSLRPQLMDLASRGYLHHATWQIRAALRRVVALTAAEPAAAEVMPLEAAEQDWIARYRRLDARYASPGGERIYCRLDALGSLEGPGWRQRLKFVETNVIGIGGISYSPPAEQIMLDTLLPALMGDDDELAFDANRDLRLLLLDELLDHARTLRVGRAPRIAFVDDKSLYTLGGEFGRLVPYFQSQGVDAVYCDPRELDLSRGGQIVAEAAPVDVIYRFLEIRDLLDIEAADGPLEALRAGFERNMVVPSAGGDLEHKSVFEILTDPRWEKAFTAEQSEVLRDHVLWTRLLHERRTTGPEGAEVDLLRFAERERERLVLKPNRLNGGEGVVLGYQVDDRTWGEALQRALAVPKSHVVQLLSPIEPEAFPVVDEDGVRVESRFCVTGLFPGRRGVGAFGRYAQSGVVNIQSGGGIAPFVVCVR